MTISGKDLAARLKARMAEQVATFPAKYGRVPHLVVILVGDDPGSQTYVRNKAKACDVVGIRNTTVRMPADTPEQVLLDKIAELKGLAAETVAAATTANAEALFGIRYTEKNTERR